ncbi:MAG TPA: asparagine synthetase B family protein [Nitrospirae bacterium]|nr:asparagine synthetase B family protein [Nitrospirota bacterium]
MDIKIINDKKYSWHYKETGNVKVIATGSFWYNGKNYRDKKACNKLADIFSDNTFDVFSLMASEAGLKAEILKLTGHFSFIIDLPGFVLAVVDKIRSYPVFYATHDETLFISNSARKLISELDLHEKDNLSELEFKMAGYVTGRETLLRDLYQLQAGESLLWVKESSSFKTARYYTYLPGSITDKNEDDLINELREVTVRTFTEMVETLDGRPVWIPLSGGLDSRFILAMLMELKYDNITTFSYGNVGHPEVKRAEKIAKMAGVKWHKINFSPKKARNMFYSREREEYFQFADGLCTTPVLSDFYALWIMREKKMITDDAVFINGQSGDFTSGGHIPKGLSNSTIKHDVQFIMNEIIGKHYSLWADLKSDENIRFVKDKILELLNLEADNGLAREDIVKYFELWEWQERQCKFVVNGQRSYEWFGYEWRLPLWSDHYMSFWVNISWEKKFNQKLFRSYLNKMDPGNIFHTDIGPHPVKKIFALLCKILFIYSDIVGKDREMMKRKYLHYFGDYAPFYNQKTYSEYLKDSYWHRNPVSYLSREVLMTLPD